MSETLVETTSGRLQGAEEGGVAVFRGIPYAAPAEGDRRLRPPEPATAWSGVREATTFGNACPQASRTMPGRPGGYGGVAAGSRPATAMSPTGAAPVAADPPSRGIFGGLFGPADLPMAEDCLTLNVWTPAADGACRPVMVWIHGGAFRLGTAGAPTYDGSALATRGDVVVVTLNYRLGPLGFLHLPAIDSVNLGLLDQVAALEWVQREIASFGGDPHHVTVFGESAGAKSIECLMTMPAARGLFQRAILESTYGPPMDADGAADLATRVLDHFSIGASQEQRIRDIPVDDLLAGYQQVSLSLQGQGAAGFGSGPVVDGDVIPRPPVDAVADGGAAAIPVIIGTTLEEGRLFGAMMPEVAGLDADGLRERLAPTLAPDAIDRLLGVYEGSPADIWFAVSTDRLFRQHSIRLAEAQQRHQRRTHMYLFTWRSPAFGGMLGACHALELPFVFGNLDGPMGDLAGTGPEAEKLSSAMQDSWLTFARSGDPGWPAYDTARRSTMVFGESVNVEHAPLEDQRRFWASVSA